MSRPNYFREKGR